MPKRLTRDEFIERSKTKHGSKYDYSLVEYKNQKLKIKVICPTHGVFLQSPQHHMNGFGCVKCMAERFKYERIKYTTETFVAKAQQMNRGDYDYSLVEYSTHATKVKVVCAKHGVFLATPFRLIRGHGCPTCHSSKGELEIRFVLTKHKVEFQEEKRFTTCKHKYPLYFDFFVPSKRVLIEFQGVHHFKPIKHTNTWDDTETNKKFEEIKLKDAIKKTWCAKNNMKLIEINFKDKDRIEEILFNEGVI